MDEHVSSNRHSSEISLPTSIANHFNPSTTSVEVFLTRYLSQLIEYSRQKNFYAFGSFFYYSPLELLGNGSFVVASVRRRAIFYALSALYAAIFFYRFYVLIVHLSQVGLDVTGLLCSLYWLSMFAYGCLYYGVWAHEDLKQVLNQSHPQCMRQVFGLEVGTFNSAIFWLKKTVAMWMISSAALVDTFFSLFLSSIPGCVYPTVKEILPDWDIPTILWQIILYPVEFLSVMPAAAPVLISIYTILIGLELLKECSENLRKMTISNLADWKKAERGYRRLRVFNQIFNVWFKRISTPAVVTADIGLVATLYVTLTSFHRLPLIIYAIFPMGAVSIMGMFILACRDAVVTTTRANQVILLLRERSGFYTSIWPHEQKEVQQRCRALRRIELPIGGFTRVTMNIPFYVFNEVLTQILLLLSL